MKRALLCSSSDDDGALLVGVEARSSPFGCNVHDAAQALLACGARDGALLCDLIAVGFPSPKR